LLAEDDGVAFGIARELEELNQRRRELDSATLDSARKQLDTLDFEQTRGVVLAGEGWHPGVIGIVASRVVEETGRPAILIAVENGVGKGSGRSIPPFDLHGALTACREHFIRFGGHRAAAGITMNASGIAAFAERFNAIARERLRPEDLVPELHVDLDLPIALASDDLARLLRHCEPHGIGNPAPMFLARGVRADAVPRRIGDSGIKARLTDDAKSLDAISWEFADRLESIDWSAPFDIAYRLERDEWQGRLKVQARLADIRQNRD